MATAVQAYSEHLVSIEPNLAGLSTSQFVDSIVELLATGKRHIVLDCSNWRKFDLSVLSALVRCADLLSRQGATLEIANLTTDMHATIRELRLHNRLRMAD